MSIALNGFKVLKRIGETPEAFASARADVDKAAKTIVVKCLKAKTANLRAMRDIREALGNGQFELVVDGLKDTELKSLLTKIDKHHPDSKTMPSQARRQHFLALTEGASEPSPPIAKTAKAKKSATKKSATTEPPKRLQSDVMDLFRARGKMRDED